MNFICFSAGEVLTTPMRLQAFIYKEALIHTRDFDKKSSVFKWI